jgi:tRNA modification GTPase
MIADEETIVALSTPPGRGGIAVVRLSGPRAVEIALKLFRLPDGRSISESTSHKAIHGFIVNPFTGRYADEVMMTHMLAPRSYTGEDVVEISCHGGPRPVEAIIDLCMGAGARPAEPGEFTRRAFLNNRMDLVQAEAVADVIEAGAGAGAAAALECLRGRLSQEIISISESLTECLTLLEASIDFSEEDLQLPGEKQIQSRIETAAKNVRLLLDTYHKGRLIRQGVNIVIAGKPNVGKSSLLNALLDEERAIVTSVPGTTRDSIEETLLIEGVAFRLTDTAGIRSTVDIVEKMGVERTMKLLAGADLCLLVLDASNELDEDDRMALKAAGKLKTLLVINKVDLPSKWDPEQSMLSSEDGELIFVSARERTGLKELKDAMVRCTGLDHMEGVVITRARHRDALARAMAALERALQAMKDGYSPEFPASDIYDARARLDSILGIGCSEDVLDRVFQQFCIGK